MNKKRVTKGIFRMIEKGIGIPEGLLKLIKSSFTYTLDFSSCKYDILVKDINKYFKHLPKSAEEIVVTHSRYRNQNWIDEDDAYTTMPGTFYDWCIYNGTIIILTYIVSPNKERGITQVLYLSCLNTKRDIHNLRVFVKNLIHSHDNYTDRNCKSQIRFITEDGLNILPKFDKRTFDDVFIASAEKEVIVSSITNFMNNKEWYKKHSIPYHFGIIFHGPAGTGKSSIIKAIAEEFDTFMYYIEPGQLYRALQDKRNWLHSISHTAKTSIVVIEDADRYSFLLSKDWYTNNDVFSKYDWMDSDIVAPTNTVDVIKNHNDQNYLGSLLNIIDGINSPSNVIWIFTTNHIERLDPALIRPGRIDKQIEIGYVNQETFDEFLIHHFGKKSDKHIVKKNLTFASIQTDVMMGMDFDQILKKYCDIDRYCVL